MQLQLRTFNTLVQDMAAAVQSSAGQLLDLTVGSTLRAVLEANASVGLWMQWLLLQVLRTTRAATSSGTDLDSWMADMTLARLSAAAATGMVTFSRFTATSAAFIPAGSLVRTADGAQTFAVSADASLATWEGSGNGYTVAAGIASLDIPVSAQLAGSAGNVQGGSIALLASAIPGIDAVTNAHAFQNGLDAETDDAFRSRFANFIASRSRATLVAVGYAISSIQQGLNYTVQENVDATGAPRMGNFVVTVDDGSGNPSSALLTTVQTAIDAIRPIGSTFSIQSPVVLTVGVSLTVILSPGINKAPVQAQVGAAIADYINGLSIGTMLPLSRIVQIAFAANAAIANVIQVFANGAPSDIDPGITGVLKAGIIAVD